MQLLNGSDIPNFERQIVALALTACLRKAENHRDLGIPIARLGLVAEVLREYTKKNGSGFTSDRRGWERQISRWLSAGVFNDFAMTPMGVMRRTDLAKLEKSRPTKKYSTKEFAYFQPQKKSVQPVTLVPVVQSAQKPAPKKASNQPKRRAPKQLPLHLQAAA